MPIRPVNMDASKKLVHIDPDGDLHLEVGLGEAAVTYVVCSKALARVSRFFKQLLYGGFAESKENHGQDAKTNWTVSLPEDDPKSILTVLYMVHAMFDRVPEEIDSRDLYGITVLTDKYDLTHILRPWARGWSSQVFAASGSVDERIWIAWELGYESLFKNLVQYLVLDLTARDLRQGRPSRKGTLQPPGLDDFLKLARLEKISELLSGPQQLMDSIANTEFGVCRMQSKDCATSMLAEIKRSLRQLGLYPLPRADEIQRCPSVLGEILLSLDLRVTRDGHTCDAREYVKNHVKHALDAKIDLPEAFLHHLQSQAKKTGLSTVPPMLGYIFLDPLH
ncbi:hypothetical protein F5Y06DRAFT_304083 [Hypoxylon sp. FL0890]|nr:hypothetical protein F5Y06DRAFT_304083 [Hypoxylon sp. FL0890]